MTDNTQTVNRGRGKGSFDTTYVIWALLAVPAVFMFVDAMGYVLAHDYRGLRLSPQLRWTGLTSSVLLIMTLMITPVCMLTGGGTRWLRAQRRYLGVASFAYAALHLAFWLLFINLHWFLKSFVRIEIVTGWLAFFIMLPLAWTSTDAAMRRLGPKWKRLQRWVYWAAILTFLHWILTAESLQRYLEPTLLSAPLIALSIWRFGFRK